MHPLLTKMARDGVTPVITRPDPSRVVDGDPVHTTWDLLDTDGHYCGLWHSTKGTWKVDFAEWEYCRFHEGVCDLVAEDGSVTTYRAGDSFFITPGFKGLWRVVEPVLKDYVIVAPRR